MKLTLIFDLINVVLSATAVILTIQVIMRTEKKLDTVFKNFLFTALVLAVATLIQLNKYVGLVNPDFADVVAHLSRMLALVFFLTGLLVMLRIIRKASK